MHMTSSFNAKIEIDAEEKTVQFLIQLILTTNSIPKIQLKQRCFAATKLQY